MDNSQGYDKTPSFFKDERYFSRYLGCTSYYRSLQRAVDVAIKLSDPNRVLELGTALGNTIIHLARKYPDILFDGVDNRQEMVLKSTHNSANKSNIRILNREFTQVASSSMIHDYDLIYMLYTFHHIPDPLKEKEKFLENCYKNMRLGGYLLICETFLPEGMRYIKEDAAINALYEKRSLEGYASTLWTILDMMDATNEDYIRFAKSIAKISAAEEKKAGNLVYQRQNEYLVTKSWLCQKCLEIGFYILLSEPINSVGEYAILLQKVN